MTKLLEIKNLVTNFYTYEGVVKALNKVSFDVEHGATFGLVGESGCGKSVTVRSIMQIVQEPGKIEAGEIFFHENKIENPKMTNLLDQTEDYMMGLRGNQISMIFQEPNAALNPTMTVGYQIAESFLFHQKKKLCIKILENLEKQKSNNPINIYLKAVFRIAANNPDSLSLKILKKIPLFKRWEKALVTEAIRRAADILEQLSIPNPVEIVKQYPHSLSGGMKQRIVIAIALASNPVLLIADEATSNLDVTIQAQILALLKDLKKRKIISSVLLITHDLGVVAETCDSVGVMYAGNLCETGDVRDIFKNPKHPYTIALLDSVPKVTQKGELKTIDGNVPNLITPPSGCRFHPRCPHAMQKCEQDFPRLKEIGPNHQVACYLY